MTSFRTTTPIAVLFAFAFLPACAGDDEGGGMSLDVPSSTVNSSARTVESISIPGVSTQPSDTITVRSYLRSPTRYELTTASGQKRFFIQGIGSSAVEVGEPDTSKLGIGERPQVLKSIVNYVQNLRVISGTSSSITCPVGYNKLNRDLNSGASGKYIYLCVSYENTLRRPSGVNNIAVYNAGSSSAFTMPTGYFSVDIGLQSNGDLNQGASGSFIYFIGQPGADRLIDIASVSSNAANPSCNSGESKVGITQNGIDADLNRGAGGQYIYLCLRS
jgi:hypothetical protein